MANSLTQEEVQKRIAQSFLQNVELIGTYTNKRSPILLKCNDCGYEWKTRAQNVLYIGNKQQTQHQCPNCKSINDKTGKEVECAYCGKKIYRTKSDLDSNKSGFFYCCQEHGNIHKNLLRKQNGEWDKSSNYRLKALNQFAHKCAVCGWNEDERILEVHHKDENRQNNSIENLCILCPTCHRKITLGYYKLTQDYKLVEL